MDAPDVVTPRARLDDVAFERYLLRRRYSNRTAKLYVGHLRRLSTWLAAEGRPTAARARADDLLDYSLTLPATYPSLSAFDSAMKAFYRMAQRPYPAAGELRIPPRPEMECRGLDADDMERFLVAAKAEGPEIYAVCCLLYYLGLRREEAATLRWDAFRADGWVVVTGKGAKDRTLWVHPEVGQALADLKVSQELADLKRRNPYVFPGRFAGAFGPVHNNMVGTWVGWAGRRAGLGHVTPHQLRHTAAARMLDESADLRGTAVFLGHSKKSLSITAGYTWTKKARLQELQSKL